MNGNEKYDSLLSGLPTNKQNIGRIPAGDVVLYESGCLVLFYEDFCASFQNTRLESVSNPAGLAKTLGEWSVQVWQENAFIERISIKGCFTIRFLLIC